MARDSERARVLGRTLLADLARSELASEEEQRLADFLLDRETRYNEASLSVQVAPEGLDQTLFIEDTGSSRLDSSHHGDAS